VKGERVVDLIFRVFPWVVRGSFWFSASEETSRVAVPAGWESGLPGFPVDRMSEWAAVRRE
jgi:hypothetical protein